MAASFIDLVVNNPVFATLKQAERASLAQLAIARNYEKGQFIIHRGDVWPYLFLVAEGKVGAIKESAEGRSLIVATLEPGELFWGLAFFHEDLPMPVSLEAQAATTLRLWPREYILPVLLRNGQSSWELCRLMVNRMLHASEIVEELAFQPLIGRVARLLLEHFPADQDSAARHLTLDEMAAHVGTTREMVCRLLYRFAEEGAIRINRTEFVFTDRSILEEHIRGTGRTRQLVNAPIG